MTVKEIAAVLDAQWLCCEEEGDRIVHNAFASDMMSDVLAYVQEDTLLLTGLVNSQSIRTAEMLDLPCVVFVRGKNPHRDAIERAQELGMTMDEVFRWDGTRQKVAGTGIWSTASCMQVVNTRTTRAAVLTSIRSV